MSLPPEAAALAPWAWQEAAQGLVAPPAVEAPFPWSAWTANQLLELFPGPSPAAPAAATPGPMLVLLRRRAHRAGAGRGRPSRQRSTLDGPLP